MHTYKSFHQDHSWLFCTIICLCCWLHQEHQLIHCVAENFQLARDFPANGTNKKLVTFHSISKAIKLSVLGNCLTTIESIGANSNRKWIVVTRKVHCKHCLCESHDVTQRQLHHLMVTASHNEQVLFHITYSISPIQHPHNYELSRLTLSHFHGSTDIRIGNEWMNQRIGCKHWFLALLAVVRMKNGGESGV